MGRGTSKVSRGSTVFNISTADVADMTVDELYSERANNDLVEKAVKNALNEVAKNQIAGMGMSQEYYAVRGQLTDLQKRNVELTREISKRKRGRNETTTPKTFVNSFGEATSRDITTQSYKNALKKMQRAILRNMGY